MPVPHLATGLSGPTLDLERCIINAMPSIEHWLRRQWQENAVPFYCPVDLRNSGFKLALLAPAQELEQRYVHNKKAATV